MRNSYTVNILIGMAIVLLGFEACKSKPAGNAPADSRTKHLYTCPMHPQVISNHPGKCSTCGTTLVLKEKNNELIIDSSLATVAKPVNEQVVSGIPPVVPEKGTRIYTWEINGVIAYDTRNQTSIASRTGGRIERLLIKYNFQPVKKGQLIMEIYSADLAAAQRELLFVASHNSEMLSAARQRLQLLGMQPDQIDQVIKTGRILYRVPVYSNSSGYILERNAAIADPVAGASPASADGNGMGGMESGGASSAVTTSRQSSPAASPVLLREGQYVNAGQPLFTIYQANSLVAEFALPPQLATGVRLGQKLLFYPASNKNEMQTGMIGLIEPVFRNGQNFTTARVYLDKASFQVGQLLTASLPIIYSDGWWVPKSAVSRLGNKAVVFRKEHNVYVPMEVETGVEINNTIQVKTNVGDWQIASNASYLVDSESFIKTNNNKQQ